MKTGHGQTSRIYLLAVLLGLATGGLMMFYNRNKPDQAAACLHAAQNTQKLTELAQGDIAAFMAARQPQILPAFNFYDGTGAARSLAMFKGKTVLLNLWASWCVPCIKEMPLLDKLQKTRGETRFSVVAISLDAGSGEKPKSFLAKNKIETLDFFHDREGESFRSLRKAGLVNGLPTSILIDDKGCVLGALAGPADWAGKDALKLIDAAIASGE